MKKVVITKSGVMTNSAIMEDPTEWISSCQAFGAWGNADEYTVQVVDLDHDYDYLLEQCRNNRLKEYPSITEYIDGVVKSDIEQQQAYIAACLAVKSKYPKPLRSE